VNATDLQNATAEDILAWTYRRFGRVALVASFQAESMVLIDLACKIVPQPEVLTLDTGRLHEETHDYIEYVREQFPIRLRILAPESTELEAMTSEHGDMLFRKSVALRNQCCAVRKVNPLARALRDYDAWITGLRRDQTPTRAATPVVASDPGHDGMIKVVPLASWSRDQVWDYLRDHGIRQHPLYDRGYTLYHQKHYVDAEASFQRFLQAEPNSELADNAQYWIGECRYSRGDMRGALAAFRETVARYPAGNKTADALLKAGMSLENLGDKEAARNTYQEVLKRYPGTAVAAVAEERRAKLP